MNRLYACLFLMTTVFACPYFAQQGTTAAPYVYPNEVIVLNRFGVYPESITRTRGPFVLFIENRLRQKEQTYDVVIKGSSPNAPMAESLTSRVGEIQSYKVVDLAPGTYEFSVRGVSKTTVLLTITD